MDTAQKLADYAEQCAQEAYRLMNIDYAIAKGANAAYLSASSDADSYAVYTGNIYSYYKEQEANAYAEAYNASISGSYTTSYLTKVHDDNLKLMQEYESSIKTQVQAKVTSNSTKNKNSTVYIKEQVYKFAAEKGSTFVDDYILDTIFGIVESTNAILNTDVLAVFAETIINVVAAIPTISEVIHTLLDIIGMFPITGMTGDALNALLYLAERNWKQVGLSTLFLIPFIGDAAAAGKLGNKALKVSKAMSKIGNKVVSFAAKFGDDIIEFIARYGDNFIRLLNRYSDDVYRLYSRYGNTALAFCGTYGDDAIELEAKYGE